MYKHELNKNEKDWKNMKVVENAIFFKVSQFDIDENIPIYEGRFCIYLLNRKYKCSGKVMYKMATGDNNI